jgi:two-component system response regulator DesR
VSGAAASARSGSAAPIRVVLAEDQGLVRGALAALLRLEGDIEVVAQAADGDEALALVAEFEPSVLVTDIEMPKRTGLELAAELQARKSATRVIIVTTFARSGYLRRALDAGVAGYLLKDRPSSELAAAVRTVHRGGRAIDPALALDSWTERDPLSERERTVLRLAGDGHSAGAIAAQLHLSDGTVRNYLSEAIGKVGASNRIEAARIARERGWL